MDNSKSSENDKQQKAKDDDIEIDFSKMKNWFKKSASDSGKKSEAKEEAQKEGSEKKEAPIQQQKEPEPQKKEGEDDDIVIDFGKITSFFKGKKETGEKII